MTAERNPLDDLHYAFNHVFLPPKLPQCSDNDDVPNLGDIALCGFAYDAAVEFSKHLAASQQSRWEAVIKMLKNLCDTTQTFANEKIVEKFLALKDKDSLVLHIRAQNAGLIARRTVSHVVFEAFEASPLSKNIMDTEGKLLCSYPGPTIKVPLSIAQNPHFVEQLVSFLVHMDVDRIEDALATTTKADSEVAETRDTTNPKYITELLIAILHGIGEEASVERITKRIADEVCWNNAEIPWRRSPLWLIVRVAVQTTAESRDVYKAWMLFFHAQMLKMFLQNDFSSDLLHTARVKTARRAYKLRDSAPPSLLYFVKDVGHAVKKRMETRWIEEQRRQSHSPAFIPDYSAFEKDTTISLLHSREYLTKVLNSKVEQKVPPPFSPSEKPRLRGSDISDVYPDGLAKAVAVEPYIALADFEHLVQERLSTWTDKHLDEESTAKILGSCLEQYISATKTLYQSRPEDQSLMLLTILDLWMALDRVVCSQIALLRSYSPEIPSSILEPLLLRTSSSLERANKIEKYLRDRHRNSTSNVTGIYSAQITYSSFSVRYFRQTTALRSLKRSIEQDAESKRESKRAELCRLNQEHSDLMRRYNGMQCEYYTRTTRWGDTYTTHSRYCSRCKLQEKADRMRITVHEWPLPTETIEAEAAVFELRCPPAFAIWRDRTYQILRDIGMAHINSMPVEGYLLEKYADLHCRLDDNITTNRISFASTTKSFLVSHYKDRKIPALNNDVCVNNGFTFRLYDKTTLEFTHSVFPINIDSFCTLRLPEGLYRHLQPVVGHTTHSHNGTIVDQGTCPIDLSIHEQLAFSNLRCGPHLQWLNIIRELRTKILTFSSDEVHSLVTQAIWQIGPLSDDGSIRLWHKELALSDFGHVLIKEATDLLSHVEGNWMECNTVKTIIYLISRLLAADLRVHEQAYSLLREARKITLHWTHDIIGKLQVTDNDKARGELQRRACETAATCRATFDVDVGVHLDALLSSSEDVATLIECAIVIHDNTAPNLADSYPDFQLLLHRDRRLSHFLEPHLARRIHTYRSGLDTAITSVWNSYQPGNAGWQRLSDPNSRWLASSTGPQSDQRPQEVHYNVLNGTLLIDGRPLGRLPEEITSHSTYARIFGQKIFDVIPADMPGMEYATRSFVQKHQIFFALRDGAPIIQARSFGENPETFELIPHDVLERDFPLLLSSEYVHWMALNIRPGEVEFRPLNADRAQIWDSSSKHWCLKFSCHFDSKMVHKRITDKLVDIQSATFQGIAARLRPLEAPKYIVITADTDHQPYLVSAELPRFRLSFFLNSKGELESKNLHSMVIDNDQSAGTMIGLTSQLVLRAKEATFSSLPRSRIVLIPHGDVHYSTSPDTNHVRVWIDTHSERRVTWYKYEVDTDLGILAGNVNTTSHFLKVYLHALTSHPLPDPLTSQRGTDFALQELATASSFSFQQLTKNDIKLLHLIGEISPKREYYPKNLHAMQMTTWSSLPVLSQHALFDLAVSKIMQYAQELTVFPELSSQDAEYDCSSDPLLMARATMRNAIYYEGSIRPSSDLDKEYHSRDCSRYSNEAIEALDTSRLVYIWPKGLAGDCSTFSDLLATFQRWGTMKGIDPNTSLAYSRSWLDLNLPAQWLSVYELCRQIERPELQKFELLFSFAALAYKLDSDLLRHIRIFLAFASLERNRSLLESAPDYASYNLSNGFEPLRDRVAATLSFKLYDLEASPAGQLHRRLGETPDDFEQRARWEYRDTSKNKVDEVVGRLIAQWPSPDPQSPFRTDSRPWFRTENIDDIKSYFASCFHNSQLRAFVTRISRILGENTMILPLTDLPSLRFSPRYSFSATLLESYPYNLRSLLANARAILPSHSRPFGFKATQTANLTNLIDQFGCNHHASLHQRYKQRLQLSVDELHSQRSPNLQQELPSVDICYAYRQACTNQLSAIFSEICSALAPVTSVDKILEDAGMWPPLSHRTVIQQLSASSGPRLTEWTETLINLARAYIEYQHSQRLIGFVLRSDFTNYSKEVDNAIFNESDARKYPEWLLIQIQGNFIIRPIQSLVAHEMITPTLKQNIALQLNMGEGKSHVIVPLVASALADHTRLVRVVVLKPLARQMFQLLVERLSGLVNRRIFFLPFSRDVKASPQNLNHIRNLFEDCARVGGILLAQPEHILSFRLMVIDRTLSLDGHTLSEAAKNLQETQSWLDHRSRDILDESDELLHIRYQLIYTMGQQQPVDDGPDRWVTTQRVFDRLRHHMADIKEKYPDQVELTELHDCGSFPHFRLLGSSASQELVSNITDDALDGMLESLSFVGLGSNPSLRSNVRHFLTVKDVDPQISQSIQRTYKTTSFWKGLLLLRGLLAHGVLVYSLRRRRWRVDYGLDPKRSLLAVPYRAKDVPSLRSEFGHPDVVICLTCLSYYYGGLTSAQVRGSFELLLKLDNPSLEYASWVQRGGDAIPLTHRELIGVNLKDVETFTQDVIPLFRRNKGTVDFFLSRVVFPKEAKEFPSKLGTSGWDLAESKNNFTTGFSGTNDNSDLLPTSITQTDPVNQLRTNAQVLEYLLRPENDICIPRRNGISCSAAEIVDIAVNESKEIRVLLDVGAQMLEMTNDQIIKYWLFLRDSRDVAAGVFFDDSDNLSIMTRDGLVEPFHSSPFSQRLDQCIVYLDDAHTRGTDLRLPPHFRALVTLGPGVTKDKLVQGCMRMRNLGHGQSVTFYAPPEVFREIKMSENKADSSSIRVADVLSWAMVNTCNDVQDHIPHWIQQGVNYDRRRDGNEIYSTSQDTDTSTLSTAWLEPAARTLDEMYGLDTTNGSLADMAKDISPVMRARLEDLGITEISNEAIAEEQEREISHELEEEPQLERPPGVPAAKHTLDDEVRKFVQHGIMPSTSHVFLPLMAPLRSASETFDPENPWAKQLIATRDFMTTTTTAKERVMLTEYLRPVNWIVSRTRDDGDLLLVVMSPYEVDALLEDFRKSAHVRLHIYAPRTSQSMKSFDDLSFYCIPPLDTNSTRRASLNNDIGYQLNIWAGQLYLDSYESYLRLCLLLGVSSSVSDTNDRVESDRFVPAEGRSGEVSTVCLFKKSPLPLLKVLFGLRRKGMRYQSTHMGKILHARLLFRKKDFEGGQ
ncbi:hypothetical protein BDN70DRAFT_997884 [Pholiota conissans]|uniref:ubiquitinyl hydrolase 1 n=1 Tax=Pholiota conissans TaxID=109636 RepID=A0A9P5YNE6_9AGAR|nr:hypothetical protein BDN70DRAFT_997884 [Pholiota conissans]